MELKEIEDGINMQDNEAVQVNETPALPEPTNKIQTVPEFPSHALDPNVPQILPLESALKPYTPPTVNKTSSNTPDFDLMALVSRI